MYAFIVTISLSILLSLISVASSLIAHSVFYSPCSYTSPLDSCLSISWMNSLFCVLIIVIGLELQSGFLLCCYNRYFISSSSFYTSHSWSWITTWWSPFGNMSMLLIGFPWLSVKSKLWPWLRNVQPVSCRSHVTQESYEGNPSQIIILQYYAIFLWFSFEKSIV